MKVAHIYFYWPNLEVFDFYDFETYSTITGAVDGLTDDDGAEDITEDVSDSALDSLLW